MPRLISPGYPYHVVARGNERQTVFFSDADYRQYLLWLADYGNKYRLKVWAYCLMPNHLHLIVVPLTECALADVMGPLQMRYARWINQRLQRTGHLWQGRFRACALDDEHLIAAVRYVERNPVRACLTTPAERWMWSSARPHCGLRRDPVLADDLPLLERVSNWSEWLAPDDDFRTVARLRQCTLRSRPCGSDEFVSRLENGNQSAVSD